MVGIEPDGSDLIVGAQYRGSGGIASEPISKLLPVGNRGGIRYAGSGSQPSHLALFSTFAEEEWPDTFVNHRLTYWGDNRTPGRELHETPKRGNLVLRQIFQMAWSESDRWRIPLICLFGHHAGTRDVDLLAILAPGAQLGDPDEDLVAVWRHGPGGWFQNYRATFSALPVQRIPRSTVDLWPTLGRSEREASIAGFSDWLASPGMLR